MKSPTKAVLSYLTENEIC